MPHFNLRISENSADIELAMMIVASFGASDEKLKKTKAHLSKELSELGHNRNLYFLESSSEIVGMVQVIFKDADADPELANSKDVAHVHSLQITMNHHRKGYAESLMRMLEENLKTLGIKKLTLGVDADNGKALNLYKKLNYTLLKTVEGQSPENPLYYLQKSIG